MRLPREPWSETLACMVVRDPGLSIFLSGLIVLSGFSYALAEQELWRVITDTAFGSVVIGAALYRLLMAIW